MPSLTIISWRDIPSHVVVKQGRRTAKVALPERFQVAIDRAAMRAGKGSSDAYMAEWRRSAPRDCGDDMQAAAHAESDRLEQCYPAKRLEQLIRSDGVEPPVQQDRQD